jgi:anti-sigma regulatory factor (Ser/Thr protein kinase)
MSKSRKTPIRGDADVARAVAITSTAARAAGLDERRVSAVSTAASEVTRNIVKYAGRGEFSVITLSDDGVQGIRIVAHDRGPGIDDIDAALRDHHSTGGTLGLGLPGVRRLMDELHVDSTPGIGTTVTATIWARTPERRVRRSLFAWTVTLPQGPPGSAAVAAAARIRPHRAERVSGDAAVLRWVGDIVLAALIDALGHGRRAAEIAARATAALEVATPQSAPEALKIVHEALRQTDGAAAGVILVDPRERSFRSAAVGNVRIRLLGSVDRRFEWAEGTLGAQYREPAERSGRLGGNALVMYSDGVSDRFEPDDDLAIVRSDPGAAARTIVDRFGKDYDDASCVVITGGR